MKINKRFHVVLSVKLFYIIITGFDLPTSRDLSILGFCILLERHYVHVDFRISASTLARRCRDGIGSRYVDFCNIRTVLQLSFSSQEAGHCDVE